MGLLDLYPILCYVTSSGFVNLQVCVVSVCQRSRKPNTERKLALGFVEALPIFAVTQRTLCVKEEESVTARFYFRF